MFTVTINTDGAAFTIESNDTDNGTPNPGPEVARLLRQIADDVEGHGITGGPLVDTNGNACGAWSLDEPEPAADSLGDTCGTCGKPANEVADHVVDGEVYHAECIPPATCERCGEAFDTEQAGTSYDPPLCASCTAHNADRVTL